MAVHVLVIESPDQEHPWGVSFDGHNPSDEDFFPMDKQTAFRLSNRLNELPRWLDLSASAPAYNEKVLYRSKDGQVYYASAEEMEAEHGTFFRINCRISHYMKIPGKD